MAQRYGMKYDAVAASELTSGPVDYRVDFGSGLAIVGTGAIRCLVNNGFGLYFDNQPTWIVNMRVSLSTLGGGQSAAIVTFRDVGSVQCQLYYFESGGVYKLGVARGNVFSGGTGIASSTLTIPTNTLIDIEVRADVNNSGNMEVRVNEVVYINSAGDFTTTANNYANNMYFGIDNNSSPTRDYYHVYVMDGTGSDHNDFVGILESLTCRPTSAGTYSQFTPSAGSNFQNVDDSTEDGDSTYNGGVLNQIDSFVIPNVPLGVVDIVGVTKTTWARRDDALAREIAPMWRIGGTDYISSGLGFFLPASYFAFRSQFPNSPATGIPWDVTEFNNAESGYKVTT